MYFYKTTTATVLAALTVNHKPTLDKYGYTKHLTLHTCIPQTPSTKIKFRPQILRFLFCFFLHAYNL